MKLLFLGDIVGRPGRKVVKQILPEVIKKEKPDFVIANGENLSGGIGINRKVVNDLVPFGIQLFTGGNHTFENDTGLEMFSDGEASVLRPENFPEGTPGKGWTILVSKNSQRLLVINLLGRVYMPQQVACPFQTLEKLLSTIDRNSYDACFVDFHAEATGEKQALRWAFDGRIAAVIGTHTHVQTNDADISPLGTAFMADCGMNGSHDSCLGVKKEIIIKKSMTQLPMANDLEKSGRMQWNAVLLTISQQGRAEKIEPLRQLL